MFSHSGTREPQAIGPVLDVLMPNLGAIPPAVEWQERVKTTNPDLKYLLSKRDPIFPPYIDSLIRSFGEGSVLEALRQLDHFHASNAYLGSVVRRISEGRP